MRVLAAIFLPLGLLLFLIVSFRNEIDTNPILDKVYKLEYTDIWGYKHKYGMELTFIAWFAILGWIGWHIGSWFELAQKILTNGFESVPKQTGTLIKVFVWSAFLGIILFYIKQQDSATKYHVGEVIYFALIVIALSIYKSKYYKIIAGSNRPNLPAYLVYGGYFLITAMFYGGYYSTGMVTASIGAVNNPPEPLVHFAVAFLVFPFCIAIYLTTFEGQKERIVTEEKRKKQEEEIKKAYNMKGWATKEEINNRLKFTEFAIHIGANFHWGEQGNICTIGGARGGKGVNLILTALLDDSLKYEAAPSFVVLDPKGENCAVSAAYLKRAGYEVHVINPFGIKEIAQFGNARISPFDMFNVYSPDFAKYLDMIAFALIPPSTKSDSTWDNAGRRIIKLYISHMMTASSEPKTFLTLYKWLHYAGTERDNLLIEMSKNMVDDGVIAAHAMSIIGHLNDDAGKMIAGMYEAAQAAMSVFEDDRLRHTVSGSDFELKDITQKKTAVFMCINPADLRRVQVWMRIIFNSMLDNLPQFYNKHRKTVILMDEFATIGKLQSFEDNFSFLPGYNVILWPIVQNITQLKTLYPDNWETFIGNAIIKHYLAIGDNTTAEYISNRLPKTLIFIRQPDGTSREIQQPLLDVDGVLSFPDIITQIKGMNKPAWFARVPYYTQHNNGAKNPFRV